MARDGKANTGQLTRILQDFGRTAAPVVGVVLNAFAPSAGHPHFGHRQLYQRYAEYEKSMRKMAGGRV